MRWSACLAAVALLLLPAGAFAWTVTVHLHGAGKVVETTPRALMNCTVGPAGKSEASVTDCVAGTPSGIYNSFDVVNLQASVPQDSFDRGWRFLKYVDSSAGGGQINCDPQDTAGDHFSVNCQFQIFENLQTNLYFDDIAGPQDTAISSGPPAATNSTSATLNFDAASDPDATYECRLDRPGEGAASFFACGGPSDKSESFSSLTTNGLYTFYVRGKDPSGNLDSTPASRAWTVDTVAPVVSLTGGPAQGSTVSSTTASFTISASEGTLSCALDAVVTGCGGTYSGLTNGPHTFSARATDAAGNSSPLVSRSWTVNTNAQTFAYTLGNTVSNGVPAAGAGNIEVAGGSDTYTFSATAGQKVFVDQLSATSCSLTWSLTGPGGATVFNSRGICADPGKFTLGSTGTYSLKVTGSATGTYSFRITNVAAPQTFAYTLGSTVVNGTPSAGAGNIEQPGSVDSYTFSAAAGQKVFVDQLAASTCSLTWSLTGPSGTTVFASRGICADPGQFTLARTGTYSLRVAGTGSAVGTFSFRITTVAPPQTFAYTVGATVGNGLPAAGAGNIELPGSVDRYTFTGAAGQKVFVDQLAAASCSLTWSLTGPGGATVFASRGICADPGKFTLAAAGTYTLSVAATGAATGTYSFRITNVAAPETFAYTVGATVSDGVPAAGAGDIELPGSVDRYTFTGAAGQKVFVDQLFASSCSLTWSLTGPGDATVFDSRGLCSDPGQITLGAAGTYTLTVLAPGAATGTYSFRITNIAAPQAFAYTLGSTVSNGTPAAGAGNIEAPGSVDTYTFTVLAGQKVFVDYRTATSCSLTWSLTGPGDSTVFDTQGICEDPGQFTLASAGTYTLRVAAGGSATGTYSFRISKVAPPQNFTYTIGDTVSPGVPKLGAGSIEGPNSMDVYTFSAAAGQTVFVDQLTATSCALVWSLTAPGGATVFESQGICEDPGQFTLPSTGTYTLRVTTPGATTGQYSFRITTVATAQAFAYTLGSTVSDGTPGPGAGNIELPGSIDTYTFTAAGGQTVFVDQLSATSCALSWSLTGPGGVTVFESQDICADPGQFTLPAGGTYTLSVAGTGSATGTYSFRIDTVPPGAARSLGPTSFFPSV